MVQELIKQLEPVSHFTIFHSTIELANTLFSFEIIEKTYPNTSCGDQFCLPVGKSD